MVTTNVQNDYFRQFELYFFLVPSPDILDSRTSKISNAFDNPLKFPFSAKLVNIVEREYLITFSKAFFLSQL